MVPVAPGRPVGPRNPVAPVQQGPVGPRQHGPVGPVGQRFLCRQVFFCGQEIELLEERERLKLAIFSTR